MLHEEQKAGPADAAEHGHGVGVIEAGQVEEVAVGAERKLDIAVADRRAGRRQDQYAVGAHGLEDLPPAAGKDRRGHAGHEDRPPISGPSASMKDALTRPLLFRPLQFLIDEDDPEADVFGQLHEGLFLGLARVLVTLGA